MKSIKTGDVSLGFQQSDHTIEGEIHMGGQEHFYLETHTALAIPKTEDGEVEMFVSTQTPSGTQVCGY